MPPNKPKKGRVERSPAWTSPICTDEQGATYVLSVRSARVRLIFDPGDQRILTAEAARHLAGLLYEAAQTADTQPAPEGTT
jgi:hypothetical protein